MDPISSLISLSPNFPKKQYASWKYTPRAPVCVPLADFRMLLSIYFVVGSYVSFRPTPVHRDKNPKMTPTRRAQLHSADEADSDWKQQCHYLRTGGTK